MPITYRSLQQLYNHWIGGGEFQQMYAGGINKVETEMGGKWSKDWDNGAKKRLSKVKAIIFAMESESKAQNESIAAVCTKWSKVYDGLCKGQLSNFHSWLVKEGKVQLKKARGKSTNGD